MKIISEKMIPTIKTLFLRLTDKRYAIMKNKTDKAQGLKMPSSKPKTIPSKGSGKFFVEFSTSKA